LAEINLSFEKSSYSVAEDAGPQPTLVSIFKEGGMVSETDLTVTVQLSTLELFQLWFNTCWVRRPIATSRRPPPKSSLLCCKGSYL